MANKEVKVFRRDLRDSLARLIIFCWGVNGQRQGAKVTANTLFANILFWEFVMKADIAAKVRKLCESHKITINDMKKSQRRGSEVGGCYYGGSFFNSMQVSGNAPDYQLTRDCVTRLSVIDAEKILTHAWVVKTAVLKKMVKTRIGYFINWTFYRSVPIDDTHTFVYPQNFFYQIGGNLVSREFEDMAFSR